jgi:uncharacterized protein YegL
MRSLIPWRSQSGGDASQPQKALRLSQVPTFSCHNELTAKREWTDMENPAPRFPCSVVADASSSMWGEPIRALNEGLQTLGTCVRENAIAARSAEIAIVRVGHPLEVFVDFTPADRFFPNSLDAGGTTPLAEGILMAIHLTEERLSRYQACDFEWFTPWILVLSDGQPDQTAAIPDAIREVRRVERDRKMSVFAVGVNSEAAENLQQFAVRRTEVLANFDFDRLFRWVSRHIIKVSQTIPGEESEDPDVIDADWREQFGD